MDENLRFEPGRKEPEVQTIQDFQIAWVFWEQQKNAMVLRLQETALSWWKYVSKLSSDAKWKDTTRARANALREYLTHSEKDNKFNHKELYDVLSCVWAVKLVPANVQVMDVAALKSEFYTNTKRPMVFAAK
jgi:hypothetical protein